MTNFYKLIFFNTLMLGTMISISSSSWMGTWMGLEINLLSFIPLISMKNNPLSSESSIKYFLVQALASSIFLFSILISMMFNYFMNDMIFINNFLIMLMNSTLLLKMGAAPFHFWFPEIIEGLSWMNSMMLMTWQKIAPMVLLSYSMKSINMIIFIIIMSTMIGSIGGLNQINLQKILTYSSINHIGWMISSFLYNEMIWMIYFVMYSIVLIPLILMFNNLNIFYLKQMFLIMKNKIIIKFLILFNILSLGGLPPFTGFFPKWIIIQFLSNNFMPILLFMIFMTLITLFFYLRISYSSMILSHNEMNFNIMINKIDTNNSEMMMSFISINGLILCTLIFSFI
uniref:NADH-ubiquinone oxidoreductase chain 2 n=1 Tax=Hygrobia hermanni TaxID=107881 RepID=A0A191ZRJ0_9COLE|nr:NADH dehydrogenase subunit 2 [Hygrobia hermanni]ANJ70485.1 NADH dehydrogenase subunit 2 [Hygrobia hermanni]